MAHSLHEKAPCLNIVVILALEANIVPIPMPTPKIWRANPAVPPSAAKS